MLQLLPPELEELLPDQLDEVESSDLLQPPQESPLLLHDEQLEPELESLSLPLHEPVLHELLHPLSEELHALNGS